MLFVSALLILPPTASSKALSALKNESAVNLVMDTGWYWPPQGRGNIAHREEEFKASRGHKKLEPI